MPTLSLPCAEEERRLYETPDHLKVSKSTRSDDQVSEAWLTGIQEIELPIEYADPLLSVFLSFGLLVLSALESYTEYPHACACTDG